MAAPPKPPHPAKPAAKSVAPKGAPASPAKTVANGEAPKAPGKGYSIKKDVVFLDGVKVGTVDPKGNFRVTDKAGKVHTGNIGQLIRTAVQSAIREGTHTKGGPSGRLRVAQHSFEVRGGLVYFGSDSCGTVTPKGDYALSIAGHRFAGNVNKTPGAVWLGLPTPALKGVKGRIVLAGKVFTAIDGVIFDGGEPIGWLRADGQFRGVTIDGDHFEGNLRELDKALYLKLVEDTR